MPRFAFGFLTLCLFAACVFCELSNESWAEEWAQIGGRQKSLAVQAKRKPDDAWKTYETRTVESLSGYVSGAKQIRYGKYGGWLEGKAKATGFFHAEKQSDRWWLVDPDGCLFIHVGVCAVRPGKSETPRRALKEKFRTPGQWAEQTTKLLWDNGFNGLGGWCDTEMLRKTSRPMPYTLSWNFMGEFGRSLKLTMQEPGHLGYPNGCIPVFHPEFEAFCDKYARSLAATKNDPYLVGHFSDNELPASRDLLDRFLSLDTMNADLAPNRQATQDWLAERRGKNVGIKDVNDADRLAFVEYVCDRYFRITTVAIRKHDPNHLSLGPRLHGWSLQSQEIFRAAGKYLDVIGVNYYGAWGPDPTRLAMWSSESGKPVMITEFYAKGADSGLPNRTGAGWVVPTQKDRGLFYQNFVLGLLESKGCVGWHWFRYMDNDPEDMTTDPSNRDSNKGIVTIRYEPYPALLQEMKTLNSEVYGVIHYLDSRL